jgi:hypothetical protein
MLSFSLWLFLDNHCSTTASGTGVVSALLNVNRGKQGGREE